MVPRPCCLPSAGHNEPTFPQATLSSDGMLVTALLATVWHTSVDKKISRCSDGVARGKSCTAWRARKLAARHSDHKIVNVLLKNGTRDAYKAWNQQDHTWVDMCCCLPGHLCLLPSSTGLAAGQQSPGSSHLGRSPSPAAQAYARGPPTALRLHRSAGSRQ